MCNHHLVILMIGVDIIIFVFLLVDLVVFACLWGLCLFEARALGLSVTALAVHHWVLSVATWHIVHVCVAARHVVHICIATRHVTVAVHTRVVEVLFRMALIHYSAGKLAIFIRGTGLTTLLVGLVQEILKLLQFGIILNQRIEWWQSLDSPIQHMDIRLLFLNMK